MQVKHLVFSSLLELYLFQKRAQFFLLLELSQLPINRKMSIYITRIPTHLKSNSLENKNEKIPPLDALRYLAYPVGKNVDISPDSVVFHFPDH